MTEYHGNSHKNREPQEPPKKELVKVIEGDVIEKPKTLGHKIKTTFFGGEFKSMVSYVASDVVLPSLRDLVFDSVVKGAENMMYGMTGKRPTGRQPTMGSKTVYNNPVRRVPPDPRNSVRLPDQPTHPFRQSVKEANDIIFPDRAEAEIVLETLIDVIDKYGQASLGDLYDLVGLPTNPIDNKWGWTYLNNAQVVQVRQGYLLDLPQMESL